MESQRKNSGPQGKARNRRGRMSSTNTSSTKTIESSAGFGQRLRYRFDNALSRGPSVVIGYLGLLTVLIIVVGMIISVVMRITGIGGVDKSLSPLEAFWQSLLRVLDAGSFAGDAGWPARILGLIVTLLGIFLAGSLIGLIANAVDQKIEDLRKGRSAVLETDHTLILGYSERVLSIVSELVVANESEKRASVVVLAQEDKTEIEDAIRGHVDDFRTTRLVCRSGDPSNPKDLERVNLAGARSVIIVNGAEGDAGVVKAALAAESALGDGSDAHAVVEVLDPAIGASMRAVLGDNLVVVNSDRLIAELTAQACRQRGLSQVFRELLDFDGDEIYFQEFPELRGHSYAETCVSFEKCAVIGVLDAEGAVRLNPPQDFVVDAGAEVIAIAGDDSEFVLGSIAQVAPAALAGMPGSEAMREIVVLGWSPLANSVLRELHEFLPPSTKLSVCVDGALVDTAEVSAALAELGTNAEVLDFDGGAASLLTCDFGRPDKVIVLAYRGVLDKGDSDARSLLSVLALRQRFAAEGRQVQIVSEMLDPRSVPIAATSGADDFIVSEELTSLMLAQLSGRRELSLVFEDLFDMGGASIQMLPASNFEVASGSSYADWVRSAGGYSLTAIGYRQAATGAVVLNPAKSATINLVDGDELVVISSN